MGDLVELVGCRRHDQHAEDLLEPRAGDEEARQPRSQERPDRPDHGQRTGEGLQSSAHLQ